MKDIPLTQGKVAIVDDDDYECLSAHKWRAAFSKFTQSYYAVRTVWHNGKNTTVCMHREILGLAAGDPDVDHIKSGETLDNRRVNLRVATRSQNCMNRRRACNNKSGEKGVHFHKRFGKYTASIQVDGKQKHLGYFTTYSAAVIARRAASEQLHKDFARY